jgi:hypothetical protein
MSAQASPPSRSYPLNSIKTHPRLQVRGGTDDRTVERYAKAWGGAHDFPPIALAEIGRKLYVIDGHHRLQAAQLAGVTSIYATQKRMTLDQAHREALRANQDHGKSLSNKEKQAALRGYIDAGLHLDDDWKLPKSLRTIAYECPVYTFQHIGRKLKEWEIDVPRDDVKPFRPYDGDDDEDGLSPEDIALEDLSLRAEFAQHLDAAQATYGLLNDLSRKVALAAVEKLLQDLSGPSVLISAES